MNRRSGRRRSLHRPQEHVLLAAERELDHAAALQRLAGDERLLVAERGVIDPQAAAADLAARFAGRGDEARADEGGQRA